MQSPFRHENSSESQAELAPPTDPPAGLSDVAAPLGLFDVAAPPAALEADEDDCQELEPVLETAPEAQVEDDPPDPAESAAFELPPPVQGEDGIPGPHPADGPKVIEFAVLPALPDEDIHDPDDTGING